MKTLRRPLAFGLAVCLALVLCPLAAPAAEVQGALTIDRESRTITLSNPDRSDGDCLRKAVEAAEDGYTIVVADYGSVNVASVGDSAVNDPWLIDKAVTIQGGRLELRCCGILLGADVTLRDTQLLVMSPIRNCILANGHTLTVDNVSVDTYTAQQMHILCGGPTLGGFTQSFQAQVPPPGALGHVIIKGSTSMGNLYAGGLYTGGTYTPGEVFSSAVPARITVDPAATGRMGTVYACGAVEQPAPENWFDFPKVDPPDPRPEQCPMEGAVTVELHNGVVPAVQGRTGGERNAQVIYNGGENAVENTALEDIASLGVESGLFRPGTLTGQGMALSVSQGAALRLIGTPSLPTVGDFSGGGSLVLDRDQTLEIQGAVSGVTTVYAGGSAGGASHAIASGHTYILASQSAQGDFLLAESNAGGETFDFDPATGAWTARREGEGILPAVDSLSLPQSVVQAAGAWYLVETVSFDVVYSENGADWTCQDLGMIPLAVTLNGQGMDMVCDDGYYYTYYADGLSLSITQDELWVETRTADPAVTVPLPAGDYHFTFTLPADYAAQHQPLTVAFTLTVEAQAAQAGDYTLAALELSGLGGQALESLPESGPCVVSVPVTRVGEGLTRCQVLLAAYSGGRLTEIQMAEVSLAAPDTAVAVDFVLADAGEATAVRAFALSGVEGLAPIAPAVGLSRGEGSGEG